MAGWLRRKFSGASEYLGGVLVAVLLVPVVPDVAVELFGADSPGWRNPALRVGALLVVVALVLVRFRVRERARVRAARHGTTMIGLGQAEVLALPLAPERKKPDKPTYTVAEQRKDALTVAEMLIDKIRPRKVLAVITPQFGDADLDRFTVAMGAMAIELVVIRIDDGNDPSIAVPQTAERLVAAAMDAGSIYVDVTGGTKAMTIGMARAAMVLGVECVYVGSQFRPGAGALPGTQQPYRFDPRTMFGPIL